MDYRISDLCTHLNETLDHQWTVAEMAENVGISLSRFTTLFTQEVVVSPVAFLKHIRHERARHQLETTRERINQIAHKVGMPEESHFTRDFKTKYGLTPRDHRRQFHEKRQADILKRQAEPENGQKQ